MKKEMIHNDNALIENGFKESKLEDVRFFKNKKEDIVITNYPNGSCNKEWCIKIRFDIGRVFAEFGDSLSETIEKAIKKLKTISAYETRENIIQLENILKEV